ncbi:sensor histidine kinase [Paenibacillus sp. 1011MAR3C5]|uniref:sensor histidine kinase n=1 Tax=Paenibacillus sp. 1011MAR3C5 TaxID=1675787 RepID=UPI000E6C8953|nr:sensor histidine kinase [Paenibacillus sp. 1011MAR3C5]RJE88786.1 sensor histidine kinase [Paenibacillus sp. 1011MAR3C5]
MPLKGISIRFRLMLLMICLTTLPVITITWQATNNTRDSVEKEMIDANESRMMWASQYLTELIQQMDTLFYSVHIQTELIEGLSVVDELEAGERYQLQNQLFGTLNTAFYSFSRKIDQLTLYLHAAERAYSVHYASSGMVHSLDIGQGPWSRMLSEPVGIYFKASGDTLSAYHSMNEFIGQALVGGISVRINDRVWEQAATILQSEPESVIFLVNDEGELLPGSSSAALSDELRDSLPAIDIEPASVSFTRTPNYYLFAKRVGNGQLDVVKAIPVATVNQSAQKTMTAGLWTGAVFTAVSILLSIIVSLRISRPIVSLAKTMRKSHIHDFEMKSVQSRDEIGLLEAGYNFMMGRIKALIENEYQHEIEVKNAQLIALQAQINPHFLNNTLHMIGGMALAKGAPEIYRITHVIGDLLRYSIRSDDDQTVSLSEELAHTANYLFIQEQRFIGRCIVEMIAQEEAGDVRIPKFTLQPIVENAFEHGLQRKEGQWRLDVRIGIIGPRLVLMVKDEGLGMHPTKLAGLRAELNGGERELYSSAGDRTERKGIGLQNVHARLQLRYGKRYGVRLFSRSGQGTMVVLTMPVTRSKSDADQATERGKRHA